MKEDWDFYISRVDDRVASFFVNLGLGQHAPLPLLPNIGYVRIHMNNPREDGLSSQEEYDDLLEVEDLIVNSMQVNDLAMFVGRVTTAGTRDLFFYYSHDLDFAGASRTLVAKITTYQLEHGKWLDVDWGTYFQYLYPPNWEMQTIMSRRVCYNLENEGDDLSKPREIDHFAYFQKKASAEELASWATSAGFSIRKLSEPDSETSEFGVHLVREDPPSQIDDVVYPLYERIIELNGQYDGWGCTIVP